MRGAHAGRREPKRLIPRRRAQRAKVNIMYIYDRKLSDAPSAPVEKSIERPPRFHLSGAVKAGPRGAKKSPATSREMPGWLQEGVRRGRWNRQTASGLWALRKISRG